MSDNEDSHRKRNRRFSSIAIPVLTFTIGALISGFIGQAGARAYDVMLPSGAQLKDVDSCSSKFPAQKIGAQGITIGVSAVDEDCWAESLSGIRPGEKFKVILSWQNTSDEQVNDATFRAVIPDGMRLIPGSTKWSSASQENVRVSDRWVDDGGINVGSYASHANAWVTMSIAVDDTWERPCGLSMTPFFGAVTFSNADPTQWGTAGLVASNTCD